MFGKRKAVQALDLPPIAEVDPEAIEVLRVWASPGEPQQFTMRTCWEDPGAWGLLLVDVANHAAKAYEREGRDPDEVLARIFEFFDAERASPTDEAKDLTDDA